MRYISLRGHHQRKRMHIHPLIQLKERDAMLVVEQHLHCSHLDKIFDGEYV